MALWASSMCFMHAASLPFFISAFDMSRGIVASFLGCFCRVIGGSCHYDKDVNNGDIGYIDNVDPDAGELNASFDGRLVRYGLGELDTLVPAYATAQVAACWR
jgi:hypothetical protein